MMQAPKKADVVICGAGIAGIATAYQLTRVHGIHDVLLVDDRPPLTLTSDKSSEAYRNWWPGPGADMVNLMDRSIDLLEQMAVESGNRFHMNQRGYGYFTGDPGQAAILKQEAAEISRMGAGPVRVDEPYAYQALTYPDAAVRGADLVTDRALIQQCFPYLTQDVVAMLHARRCGWLSAQQLGMYMLEQARDSGASLINARIVGVDVRSNLLQSVTIQSPDGRDTITTGCFVIAAGPLLADVASLLGVHLPVYNEVHGKVAFEDTEGIIKRDAPLMIWNDPLRLPWEEVEKADLIADEATSWLLDEFPGGLHFRPEGGPGSQTILVIWPFHIEAVKKPMWPIMFSPEFVEISMRGMVRMVPDLAIYLERMGRPVVDGGYYCKTKENRPLICPLPVNGAYVIGALSGYGIMAAPAAAELLSAHIVRSSLPSYAPAFDVNRYQNPTYLKLLENWSSTAGQL